MKVETYIVDSFTDEPFKGNPAGVCLLQHPIEDSQMLTIAQELGFSETAFVIGLFDSQDFQIRFFSPKMEIPHCGHATLASAKVMFFFQLMRYLQQSIGSVAAIDLGEYTKAINFQLDSEILICPSLSWTHS